MSTVDWLKLLRYLSLVTGIGLTFSANLLLGWYLGTRLGGPWLLLGILAGVCSGAFSVYAIFKKLLPKE